MVYIGLEDKKKGLMVIKLRDIRVDNIKRFGSYMAEWLNGIMLININTYTC